jgi:hypothetical protein
LFLNGRTDTGVPPTDFDPAAPPAPPALVPGGSAQNEPMGFEKDYGHEL